MSLPFHSLSKKAAKAAPKRKSQWAPALETLEDRVTPALMWSQMANVTVTEMVSTTKPMTGHVFTLKLSVTDSGPAAATNIAVRDLLPAGLTLVSASGMGSYNAATGIWSVPSLAAGQTESISLSVKATTCGKPETITAKIVHMDQINCMCDAASVTITPECCHYPPPPPPPPPCHNPPPCCHSVTPPACHSTTPPACHSTTPPACHSTTPPVTCHSTTPPACHSSTPPACHSTAPPTTCQSTTPPACHSTTPPVACQSTTPPACHSVTPPACHSATPPVCHSNGGHSNTPPCNGGHSTTPVVCHSNGGHSNGGGCNAGHSNGCHSAPAMCQNMGGHSNGGHSNGAFCHSNGGHSNSCFNGGGGGRFGGCMTVEQAIDSCFSCGHLPVGFC